MFVSRLLVRYKQLENAFRKVRPRGHFPYVVHKLYIYHFIIYVSHPHIAWMHIIQDSHVNESYRIYNVTLSPWYLRAFFPHSQTVVYTTF
jgi:hypothetical protein